MIYWNQIDEFNEPNWEKVGTQKRECAGRAAIDAYNVRGSFAANGFVSTKLFFPASRLKEPAETDNGRKRLEYFKL